MATRKFGFPLEYKDLVIGEAYATHFEGQGLYIFLHGYSRWLHTDRTIVNSDGRFSPDNGFDNFRKALPSEAKELELSLTEWITVLRKKVAGVVEKKPLVDPITGNIDLTNRGPIETDFFI